MQTTPGIKMKMWLLVYFSSTFTTMFELKKKLSRLSLWITLSKDGTADTNKRDITINNTVLTAKLSTAGWMSSVFVWPSVFWFHRFYDISKRLYTSSI